MVDDRKSLDENTFLNKKLSSEGMSIYEYISAHPYPDLTDNLLYDVMCRLRLNRKFKTNIQRKNERAEKKEKAKKRLSFKKRKD